jgi:hypothetical protein
VQAVRTVQRVARGFLVRRRLAPVHRALRRAQAVLRSAFVRKTLRKWRAAAVRIQVRLALPPRWLCVRLF